MSNRRQFVIGTSLAALGAVTGTVLGKITSATGLAQWLTGKKESRYSGPDEAPQPPQRSDSRRHEETVWKYSCTLKDEKGNPLWILMSVVRTYNTKIDADGIKRRVNVEEWGYLTTDEGQSITRLEKRPKHVNAMPSLYLSLEKLRRRIMSKQFRFANGYASDMESHALLHLSMTISMYQTSLASYLDRPRKDLLEILDNESTQPGGE